MGAALTVKHADVGQMVDICEKNAEGNLNLRPESATMTAYEVDAADYIARGGELFDKLMAKHAGGWSGSTLDDAVSAAASPLDEFERARGLE